jgi:hypothetical protein
LDRLLTSSTDEKNPAALGPDLDCLNRRVRLALAQSAAIASRLATTLDLACIFEFMLLTLALGDHCAA